MRPNTQTTECLDVQTAWHPNVPTSPGRPKLHAGKKARRASSSIESKERTFKLHSWLKSKSKRKLTLALGELFFVGVRNPKFKTMCDYMINFNFGFDLSSDIDFVLVRALREVLLRTTIQLDAGLRNCSPHWSGTDATGTVRKRHWSDWKPPR